MKTTVVASVLAIALGGLAAASAQTYPAKPIRMVVPYPPGGGNDTFGRLVGQKLGDRLGQQVVVENRPGAGATLGTEVVAKSPPDGYTLLLGSIATHAISPSLYSKVNYDPVRDFAPITVLAVAPTVLIAGPQVAARSLAELLAAARAQPGKLTYASGGNGTPPHISAEVFKAMTATDLLHIPFKGGGPALVGLMGGQVDLMFDTAASAMPHVKAGKLRALAIATAQRSGDLPEVPTFTEAGLSGYEVNSWYAVLAPAGTPPEIVARLHREITASLREPDMRERLRALGTDPVGNTPEEFGAFIRAELAKYAKVIRDAKIKVD
jgi:tripartite-type tricarboxylate transporter receptor subunit TctC